MLYLFVLNLNHRLQQSLFLYLLFFLLRVSHSSKGAPQFLIIMPNLIQLP